MITIPPRHLKSITVSVAFVAWMMGRAQEDGSYLLLENHCPICAAAEACQGFCRSELLLFRALLAPATVERTEHILDGARRCAYRVTP